MLERISFTLDELRLRANALLLGSTNEALAKPEKTHRLERTTRQEATCTCGRWSCRTDELEEVAITRTFDSAHAAHITEECNKGNRP